MALFATIIFVFSLIGIAVLFVFKAWEVRRGYVVAPELRLRADQQALRLKAYIMNGRQEVSKIIPFMTLMMRYFIHEGALAFARAAHFTGVQAHRLADFVSHKHHFERQAPRSEFLKQVAQTPRRPTLTADPITSAITVEAVVGSTEPKHEVPAVAQTTRGLVSEVAAVAPVGSTAKHRTLKKKKPRIAAPSLKHGITNHFYDEM